MKKKKKNVRGIADALRTSVVFASYAWWCMSTALQLFFFFFLNLKILSPSLALACLTHVPVLHSIDSFSFIQFKKIAYYRLSQADVLGSNNDCFKFSVQQLQRLS